MDLQHRRLLPDSIEETCKKHDCEDSNDSGVCSQQCLTVCPDICLYSSHHQNKPNKFVIITIVFLVTTFLFVCCYAIYCKFYLSSRRRSQTQPQPQPQPQADEIYDEFLDEDHGPVVDHHIWYINTIGLQPSIINEITVCKYKRGDGLVEGTECSVCLNEFQEDDTLRLLPKCNHAFHIPCIDTWLRSHTNCPLCRAPIVKNTAGSSSSEANVDNSGVGEETRLNISEENEEVEREMDGGVHELRSEAQEECELAVENESKRVEDSNEEEGSMQPMRRSVSLDSLSALKISQALGNVIPMESNGNSDTQLVMLNESNTGIVPKGVGNQSLLRLMASSSIGRSLQNGSIPLKRSFSCSGKFLLSRYSRSRDPNFRM